VRVHHGCGISNATRITPRNESPSELVSVITGRLDGGPTDSESDETCRDRLYQVSPVCVLTIALDTVTETRVSVPYHPLSDSESGRHVCTNVGAGEEQWLSVQHSVIAQAVLQ
jgi:hypothetical protein